MRNAVGCSLATMWNNDVVRNIVVIRSARIMSTHLSRGRSVTVGNTTSVPPAVSVLHTSNVLASNAGLDELATRSPGAIVQ